MNGWGNLKDKIMTPKEKAQELLLTFYSKMNPNAPDCNLSINQCKRCALIVVDEVLNAVTTIADKKYDYFLEVKQEIEKL